MKLLTGERLNITSARQAPGSTWYAFPTSYTFAKCRKTCITYMQVPRENLKFTLKNIIGKGNFGTCYRIAWMEVDMAVKKIIVKKWKGVDELSADVQRELEINIVTIIQMCLNCLAFVQKKCRVVTEQTCKWQQPRWHLIWQRLFNNCNKECQTVYWNIHISSHVQWWAVINYFVIKLRMLIT